MDYNLPSVETKGFPDYFSKNSLRRVIMKKFLVLLLAAVMVFSFAACGGGSDGGSSESSDEMKVAMVTDYGDITDQSFNQTTYEACKAFCEANDVEFTYKKPASDADADRVSSIEEAIEEGYNVIVMPGYAFANAIYEVAPLYEDVKFVALDVSEGDLTANGEREFDGPNVYSAVIPRRNGSSCSSEIRSRIRSGC